LLWLAVAFPVEILFSVINGIDTLKGAEAAKARFEMLFSETGVSSKLCDGEIKHSTIPPIAQIAVWAVAATLMYRFDRKRTAVNRRAARAA
jgi:hypothetical protein